MYVIMYLKKTATNNTNVCCIIFLLHPRIIIKTFKLKKNNYDFPRVHFLLEKTFLGENVS